MNILLISENNEFALELREKLIFLRRDDKVLLADYTNFEENLKGIDVVLVHQSSDIEKSINVIKDLHKNKDLTLIFVPNTGDDQAILSVSDLGVDDFITSDAKAYEFVIRIVNNIQKSSTKHLLQKNLNLLKEVGIVDEFSDFYKYEYCKKIIDEYREGAFVVISPCDKVAFSLEGMTEAIKSSIRVGDIVFLGKGANFYLFLPNTDLNGTLVVFNKINELVEIRAGMSDISNKTFEEFEKDALNALADAPAGGYVFAQIKESTLDEWLSDVPSGGYKLFRKMFNSKLEKVIAPVFYRLQKSYEEKLLDTQIEQYTNSEQCVFTLKNKNGESSLRIVYPGFAKVMIYIEHEGLDSPENREISLQLDKVTSKELIRIVEDFIEEFKETKC